MADLRHDDDGPELKEPILLAGALFAAGVVLLALAVYGANRCGPDSPPPITIGSVLKLGGGC